MPIDQLPRTVPEAMKEATPEAAAEPAPATAPASAGPRQTLAMRLAARNGQRELRAARLARLRAGPGASSEAGVSLSGAPETDTTFLEVYLRGLPLTSEATPDALLGSQTPDVAGAVLPFLGTTIEAATDLGRLPGAGPGLVQALRRAGMHRLSDLAGLEPGALAARLGPIGRLVPAGTWIAAARAEAEPLAEQAVPPRPEAAGTAR